MMTVGSGVQWRSLVLAAALVGLMAQAAPARAAAPPDPHAATFPWSDPLLSPDRRADLVMARMTLEEKLQLVHGAGLAAFGPVEPSIVRSNGGAGFVPGIARLGIPDLNMSDSAVGIANTAREGRYSTALPSALALASSWDEKLAFQYGSLIGTELADQGFNVSLGGGVNLARDPRDGRIFEFLGEDPILAGRMDARVVEGIQSQHIIGDVKHFAVNDQETGRSSANAIIGQRALQETDLLAFRIAIGEAHPGMVMCAYNLVNGVYSCQNRFLLAQTLKGEWGFKGWVISDWGGTHSTVRAALAGLDMEMPGEVYFGKKLAQAVASGRVPMARLNDMVHRILRSEFAAGIVDHPSQRAVPDIFHGFAVAQDVEEESAVLLKNSGVLPLDPRRTTSIAVIGSHSDVGVLSGGGSSQVNPPGGNAVHSERSSPAQMGALGRPAMWDPSSPLKAIRSDAAGAQVTFDPGVNIASAVAAAKAAQVAVVFVHQHLSEGADAPSLQLPGNQNALVAAVAAANPDTVVVLETGGPVAMTWADQVAGILEAWYPGIRGGRAIANLLFGTVNPSGKLAVTFPQGDDQLPHRVIPAPAGPKQAPLESLLKPGPRFDVRYTEGLEVGYKWFDARREQPLFPFGYGLSYSRFAYSALSADMQSGGLTVRFSLRNAGVRAGAEVAEVYLVFPQGAGEPPKRLIGWARVPLQAGQSQTVSLKVDPLYLSVFDTGTERWRIYPGSYQVQVGTSSRDLPLAVTVRLR